MGKKLECSSFYPCPCVVLKGPGTVVTPSPRHRCNDAMICVSIKTGHASTQRQQSGHFNWCLFLQLMPLAAGRLLVGHHLGQGDEDSPHPRGSLAVLRGGGAVAGGRVLDARPCTRGGWRPVSGRWSPPPMMSLTVPSSATRPASPAQALATPASAAGTRSASSQPWASPRTRPAAPQLHSSAVNEPLRSFTVPGEGPY